MAEVTNDLIYEILRKIKGRLGSLDEGLREVRGEIAALRGHVIAVQQDTANVHGRIAAMEVCDHIERRLDIADAPSV